MPHILEIAIEGDLPPGLLAEKARGLRGDHLRAGVAAQAAPNATRPDERGAAAALGKFVLDSLAEPAAKALLDAIKRLVLRDRSIKVVLTRPDGAKVEIEAKNVASAEVAAFIGLARDSLG